MGRGGGAQNGEDQKADEMAPGLSAKKEDRGVIFLGA